MYREASDTIQPIALFYDTASSFAYAAKPFFAGANPPAPGWRQAWIHPTYRVNTSLTYRLIIAVISYYYRNVGGLSSPVTRNGIKFMNSFVSTNLSPIAVPPTTTSDTNAVDVLFQPD